MENEEFEGNDDGCGNDYESEHDEKETPAGKATTASSFPRPRSILICSWIVDNGPG